MEYNFYENVYDVVRLIPKGRVTSYGAIAKYLGAAKSSRAVGYALNQCAGQGEIPAHRVVNRNGLLSGRHHFPTSDFMRKALEKEGIPIKDEQVQELGKYYWDPAIELDI